MAEAQERSLSRQSRFVLKSRAEAALNMDNRCCVKCDSVLDRGTLAGIDVDLCPACGGLWLDKGELEKLGKGPKGEVDKLRGLLTGNPFAPPNPSELQTACPACPGRLKEVVLGPVHVDFCDTCGGLFLDRDELDQAMKAAAGHADVATVLRVAAAAAA